MKFLERDLEQVIIESEKCMLVGRGLYANTRNIKQQLRIGRFGRSDLISFNRFKSFDNLGNVNSVPVFTVFELKKNRISVSSFLQATRYVSGIKDYLLKKGYKNLLKAEFHIYLIGDSLDVSGDFIYLPEVLQSRSFRLSLVTYSFNESGIIFKHHRRNINRGGF